MKVNPNTYARKESEILPGLARKKATGMSKDKAPVKGKQEAIMEGSENISQSHDSFDD